MTMKAILNGCRQVYQKNCRQMCDFLDDLNAKIIETHCDVKWICRTLEEMKETDVDFETRLRDLEGWAGRKGRSREVDRRYCCGCEWYCGGPCGVGGAVDGMTYEITLRKEQ